MPHSPTHSSDARAVGAEADLTTALDDHIAGIIRYLHRRQQPNGGFPNLRKFRNGENTYASETEFDGWYYFGECPFATASIVYHLRRFEHPLIRDLLEKACDNLEAGMENGVARYVPSIHKPADVPTDVDDACLAVAALRAMGRTPAFNRAMILDNRDGCGNFHTWLVPRWRHLRHPWNYVWLARDLRACHRRMRGYGADAARLRRLEHEYAVSWEPAVAANVLLCTGIDRATRRSLDAMIRSLRRGVDFPTYYEHPLVAFFHVARLYEAGVTEVDGLRAQAVALIRTRMAGDGGVDGPFNSVMAALTLMMFNEWDGDLLDPLLGYLLAYADGVGEWVPLHYFNDLHGMFVDGGAELTAAFHLDAFDRYRSRLARAR